MWAVTTHGIECLVYRYDIGWNKINSMDWYEHIRSKRSPVTDDHQDQYKDDFSDAYGFSKEELAKQKIGVRKRYLILERDSFRCQLCGRSAIAGTVLEIDHRHPKSQTGSSELDNLWTLCFDCNQGKSNLLYIGKRSGNE